GVMRRAGRSAWLLAAAGSCLIACRTQPAPVPAPPAPAPSAPVAASTTVSAASSPVLSATVAAAHPEETPTRAPSVLPPPTLPSPQPGPSPPVPAAAAIPSPLPAPALPLTVNDVVLHYVHYLTTTDRSGLETGLRRAGRFRAMATRIFQAQGIPTDLFYMAQLESGFNPTLVNRSGARGMWQFMAVRSDDYGLKRTHWVDERQDPEKSTLAAARHLKDLFAEFGDWYLAMVAYDTGPHTIQKLVAKTGYADYWELYATGALPRGVRNYVPIVLATALIADNPAQYGLADLQMEPPDDVETFIMADAVDLRLAAECARVTVADLQHFNPSLLHLRAPAGFELKVPAAAVGRFQQTLLRVPESKRLVWRVHWVAAGETWGTLSRRFRVSVARLKSANPGAAPRLDPGTAVVLPLAGTRSAPSAASGKNH
ncbi:MAG: transglycosylase SLT domain-containing protein, partial [Terriglobales bacterium]